MTALALTYRPKKLAEVVGQDVTTQVIKAMVIADDLPPVLVFGGTSGSGKTTTARILAAALNCPNTVAGEPCGECSQCEGVWQTNSGSYTEIDAASNNGVKDVLHIQDMIRYHHEGSWRVIVLDEVHMLTREAFNAFLKTLEEPPERTVFVMLTTEVHKIPETIQSRAMKFNFRRITPGDIVFRLQHVVAAEGITASDELLALIARHAKGGMRDAIMTLDQASRIGITDAAAFREQFGALESGPPILRAAIAGDVVTATVLAADDVTRTGDAGELIRELTETVRDLIVIVAQGVPPCLPQQLEERKALAAGCAPGSLPRALRVLWAARERVRGEDDQVTAAQVIVMLLCEVFAPVAQQIGAPITAVEAEPPMSLADMQALVASTLGS